MEHTHIEQFEEKFGNSSKDNFYGGIIGDTSYNKATYLNIKAFILKVRTETLMECRGLVEGEIWKSHELNEEFEKKFSTEQVQEINELCLKSHNNGMDDLCTAIDNLINKEI